MGFIYKVAVPAESWPTARALDAALERQDPRVRLLVRADSCDEAFATAADETLELLYDGAPFTLDSRDYLFDPDIDDFDLANIMRQAGMDVGKLDGAHVFSITTHGDPRDWDAAAALLSVMVRDFGGYGMDFQTNSAGSGSWADGLAETLQDEQAKYHQLVARFQAEDGLIAGSPHPVAALFARFAEVFGDRGNAPGQNRRSSRQS